MKLMNSDGTNMDNLTKNCIACGVNFTRKPTSTRKTCSPSCGGTIWGRRHKKNFDWGDKYVGDKECPQCKKTFKSYRVLSFKPRKYCSRICSVEGRRKPKGTNERRGTSSAR